MSDRYLLYAIIAMATVTFLIRALPALIPQRYLVTPWLQQLNTHLPLTVLVLLIATSLSYQDISFSDLPLATNHQVHLLAAQLGAILTVLVVYHLSRQLLLSIVVGIGTINALLWLLG